MVEILKQTAEDRELNFQWFSNLKGIHQGEEAWLFGKGPSFDNFNEEDATGIKATINEALYFIDSVDYAFTWHCDKKNLTLTGDTELIDGTRSFSVSEMAMWSPERKATFIKHGTGELAVSYLIWMGIKKLNFVGMDGTGKYGSRFEWWQPESLDMIASDKIRAGVKERMFKMLNIAEVEYIDHSQN